MKSLCCASPRMRAQNNRLACVSGPSFLCVLNFEPCPQQLLFLLGCLLLFQCASCISIFSLALTCRIFLLLFDLLVVSRLALCITRIYIYTGGWLPRQKHGGHAGGEEQARVGPSRPTQCPWGVLFPLRIADRELLAPSEGVGLADQGAAEQTGTELLCYICVCVLFLEVGGWVGLGRDFNDCFMFCFCLVHIALVFVCVAYVFYFL